MRQRHTVEGVQKILDAETTPPWLKRAIRLALLSLQRREDLVTWERAAVDMSRNVIRVSPGKTENYSTPIHLEIEMGADLRAVVQECLKEPIASPYLICYQPKARKREQIEAKLHWSAVTDDYLTKEFRKARDLAKAYDHIENPKARPTMHELRALGSWLYEQQGFSTEYVQALLGHATPEMTAYYQDGHEQKEVIYQHVQAAEAGNGRVQCVREILRLANIQPQRQHPVLTAIKTRRGFAGSGGIDIGQHHLVALLQQAVRRVVAPLDSVEAPVAALGRHQWFACTCAAHHAGPQRQLLLEVVQLQFGQLRCAGRRSNLADRTGGRCQRLKQALPGLE